MSAAGINRCDTLIKIYKTNRTFRRELCTSRIRTCRRDEPHHLLRCRTRGRYVRRSRNCRRCRTRRRNWHRSRSRNRSWYWLRSCVSASPSALRAGADARSMRFGTSSNVPPIVMFSTNTSLPKDTRAILADHD